MEIRLIRGDTTYKQSNVLTNIADMKFKEGTTNTPPIDASRSVVVCGVGY
jgi:hypothetical protein